MNSSVSTIVLFVAIMALMYFMMIRPQKKQQQKRKEMMNQLKKGDRVITIGRLHGVIDSINDADQTVTLDCDGIFLTFDRTAIGRVIPAESTTEKTATKSTTIIEKPKTEDSSEDETK
ncbi:preprotein translocase subunit YajC [Liquorilactobacillus mali]|uniref:preprotein translocase subunit YajC n=1 Tax=Liquorilactobacillus mali TaxID=1618 RepID=UPI00235074FD|nr:preprotein translocase subunit YajC [Liquorilactobacillus mali]MDC7952338.1 preprotein translocase subunit YajC [Liquorilactobacillus mali]MDV7756809.1 preprotein translocase subunit YajC [Liquorilactobacillus mali]